MNAPHNNPAPAIQASGRVTVEATRDLIWLDSMLRTWGWEALHYDGCGERSAMTNAHFMGSPWNTFLMVRVDGVPAGYFRLEEKCGRCFEPHVILSPSCRGKLALEAVRLMAEFAANRLEAGELVAFCPDWCKHTLALASAAGFKILRRERRAIMRDGVAHDFVRFQLFVRKTI